MTHFFVRQFLLLLFYLRIFSNALEMISTCKSAENKEELSPLGVILS